MSMGKNIAYFRKSKGYTQEELGQMIGVTNQAVSKWESEISMPDVMMLPRIADALDITLNDLFTQQINNPLQAESHILDMDAVHSFAKDSQTKVIDTLYRQTNLVNVNIGNILKVEKNHSTKIYDYVKPLHTLCCLSDTTGAVFVSNTLTLIDSGIVPTDIGPLFDKPEIASGIKKLSDVNVRRVLSHICNDYFQRSAPFDDKDPEYFTANIDPKAVALSVGLTIDDVLEALEKLISLHIVDLCTENGTHYLLHKVKAIEAAVTFRLIERFIHNEFAMGCGEFLTLNQF